MSETRWTAGPWAWHTSNSWRRLKHDDRGKSENVLEPYVCRDGHPDLIVSAANARLISVAPDLAEVAQAYEKWEADLILSDKAWSPAGMAEHPRLTAELWDRLIEIQAMRNAALAKAKGE